MATFYGNMEEKFAVLSSIFPTKVTDIFRVRKTSTKTTVMTYLRLRIPNISLSPTFLVKASRCPILKIV